MTTRAHRLLRLPADHRTPAVARAAVRQVLLAGGRADQLDEALLLVSELSTNGVVHAGTAVDVEISADEFGVTITVSDRKAGLVGGGPGPRSSPYDLVAVGGAEPNGRPGEPASSPDPDPKWEDTVELAERGRGLVLVNQLATSWGTRHYPTGKSVWVRLGPDPDGATPGIAAPLTALPDVPEPAEGGEATGAAGGLGPPLGPAAMTAAAATAAALTEPELDSLDPTRPPLDRSGEVPAAAWVWLVHVPDSLRARLTMPQLVSELLERLCEVTGAASAAVWLDRGDAAGRRRLAGYSSPRGGGAPEDEQSSLVTPLPLSHPLTGSVELYPVAGGRPGRYWPELAAMSAQRMAISIDAERLHSDDLRRRGWLAFLAEASELLANSLDVDLTLALVPQLAVPRLGSWCAVHRVHPRRGLTLEALAHSDEAAAPGLRALLGADAAADVRARLQEVAADGGTVTHSGDLAGVSVPLAARGRALGVLTVGRFPDRLHAAEDIAVVADLARRASLALDNAVAHAERVRVARDLQQSLLPPELPRTPGLDFGAEYAPASSGLEVGGDFYDVSRLEGGSWLVCIGDVCGKGTQAAVVTGVVRDVMRTLAAEGWPLPRILGALNRTLLARGSDRYATVAAATISGPYPVDEALHVSLCLAGHDRPILLRPDGSTEMLGECGTAVGLIEDFEVTEHEVRLGRGESLIFVTDGVTERRNGTRMYGTRRLRLLVADMAGQSAARVAAGIREDVQRYCTEPPRDDIAVLVVANPA